MGLFSSSIEKQLVQSYIMTIEPFIGIKEARKHAKKYMQMAKTNAKKNRGNKLPTNYGDVLCDKYLSDEKIKTQIDMLKKEGVIEEDIRQFWNMHYLVREMATVTNDQSRVVGFLNAFEKYGDKIAAEWDVRKHFPIYGDYNNLKLGDDRPLPPELTDRINLYIEKRKTDNFQFKKDIEKSSTFNTLIREEIRAGNL